MKFIRRMLALFIFIMVIIGIIYAIRHQDDNAHQPTTKVKLTPQQAIEKIINNPIKTDYSFNIKEIKSNSGITIWYKHEPNSPVISINFTIKEAGGINVSPDKIGLSGIASSVITRGLPNKSFEQIADELNKKNISISFGANIDDFTGSATCLTEDKDLTSTYINDFLNKATFPDDEIEILKKSVRLAIIERDKSASFPPAKKMDEILFKDNKYYKDIMNKSSIETINNISSDDIKEYISSLNKSKLHVSIVCPLSEEEVKEFIDNCFKDLKDSNKAINMNKTMEIIPVKKTTILEHKVPVKANNTQSNVLFFIGSIVKNNPRENIKLSILSKILDKALFDNIRSKEGLTYHISTSSGQYRHSNLSFIGNTSIEIKNVQKTMQKIREVLSSIAENGVDEATFKKNRNSFINHIYRNLTSNNRISSLLSYLAATDMEKDYLNKREEIALSINLDEFNDFIKNTIRTNEVFFVYSSPE